ncbi:MAG: hypothetical protein SFV81_12315 [Pirellulaceae bacterium]|nr:hypothetical protein [Pirellulaceae bacterium]
MPQVDSTLSHSFPHKLLELIENAPLSGLAAGPKCKSTAQQIETLLVNIPALQGSLTEAGLWLLAGELDRSHSVSQSLETAEGSYWHGIMHRREGDFWNAKYWFRRVGRHPVLEQLASFLGANENAQQFVSSTPLPIRELSSPTKVAEVLVECCERALSSKPEQVNALQRICWLEWQFLFLYGCDI